MVDYNTPDMREWAIENFIECAGEDIGKFATVDKTEFRNALQLALRRDELKRPKNTPAYTWQLLRPKNLGGRPRTSRRQR